MRLFLFPNNFNPEQLKQAAQCFIELVRQGHQVSLSAADSEAVFNDTAHAEFTAKDCDIIVSLGGDGAVLRASQLAIDEKKPLIGINSGHVGFLCAMSFAELSDFSDILSEVSITERSLLEFTYNQKTYTAINDVIVAKENYGVSANLTLSVEGLGSYRMRGDGLVIASPTGSTAYNYSADGPILDPRCHNVVITPLSPHNRNLRPLVIDNSHIVTITDESNSAVLLSDGHELGALHGEVRITRSEKILSLYTKNDLIQKIQ